MYIDTHCHLDFKDYDEDRESVIARAKEKGIDYIIDVGSSLESSRRAVELAKMHDFIYASVGIHPHDAKDVTARSFDDIEYLASRANVIAIGEVGLDYFRNLSPQKVQRDAFIRFLRLKNKLKLPVIIHIREAHQDALEVLKAEAEAPMKGVIHCFSGDKANAKAYLDMGLDISFTCNITYKKSEALKDVVKYVPIERTLLETDAPFLPPQELRGERNEPAYITYLAEEIAKIKGLTLQDVGRITSLNAKTLFKIGSVSEEGEIVYKIRDTLYINLTTNCTDNCTFCVRGFTDFVKGHNLRLKHEPSAKEVIRLIGDPKGYKEIVFCGYGEPLLKLDIIKEVARELKAKGAHIRIDTNGHGNLIHKRSVVSELAGLVDEVCVSLNAESKEKYYKLCKPVFGIETYEKIKEFIRECRALLPKVTVTAVDMPEINIKECERIAREELKVGFRKREYNVVG